MSRIIYKEGAAAYGRPKEIVREVASCDVCSNRELCLGFDHSDGEYGTTWICHMCCVRAFMVPGDHPDFDIDGDLRT